MWPPRVGLTRESGPDGPTPSVTPRRKRLNGVVYTTGSLRDLKGGDVALRGVGMARVVVRSIQAGIARADNLVPRQISDGIPWRVSMAKEQELDPLLAVVKHQLVVEDHIRHFQAAVGDILAAVRATTGFGELSIIPCTSNSA